MSEERKENMNLESRVSGLQTSLTQLIETCNQLAYENQVLKKREHQLLQERSELQSRNDQARVQIESMVSRLKSSDAA